MLVALTHDEYNLIRVEPEHVDDLLPHVEPILKKAIPYTAGFESVDAMVATMKQGARPWQLWIMFRGATPVGGFLSTLERVGGELVFQFEILAGVEAQNWILPMIRNFEKYIATMYGVTQVRIIGREGWARFLRDAGYAPQAFITAKRFVEAGELDQCITTTAFPMLGKMDSPATGLASSSSIPGCGSRR